MNVDDLAVSKFKQTISNSDYPTDIEKYREQAFYLWQYAAIVELLRGYCEVIVALL